MPTRGRTVERRCFACDEERMVMPSFGAYTGGLSIRDVAFTKIFGAPAFMAHVLGERAVHSFVASRCSTPPAGIRMPTRAGRAVSSARAWARWIPRCAV